LAEREEAIHPEGIYDEGECLCDDVLEWKPLLLPRRKYAYKEFFSLFLPNLIPQPLGLNAS